jgi:hypothetical protein
MNTSTTTNAKAAAAPARPPLAAEQLPDDPAVLQRMIGELVAALQTARQENAQLRQRLDALVRRLHGPRGPRLDPNQPSLFDEVADAAAADTAAVAAAASVAQAPAAVEPAPAAAHLEARYPPQRQREAGRQRKYQRRRG